MAREIKFIEKLNPASYRSVPFLVPDESVERGQKVAVHEYPNSDKRFVEPLGKLPPDIDLTGIIHGEFFFEIRQELELALEREGIGELVHPIYGPIQVQPGKFSVKSNQKEVGKFTFYMKFYVSDAVEPTPLISSNLTVSNIAEAVRLSTLNATEAAYQPPIDANALESAVDSVLSVLDTVNDAVNLVVDPIEEFAAKTNTAIAQFRNGVYSIMQTGAGLKDNLLNVYNNFVQLSSDPSTLSEAWLNLINFDGPATPETTTAQRINRVNNQLVVEQQAQLIGLIGGFESAANTDFNTEEELQQQSDFLDEKFAEFFQVDSATEAGAVTGIDDPTVKADMLNLRVATKTVFDQQRAKVWKIIDINPGKSSMALTTHRWYGSLDNLDALVELNPNLSVSNFESEIKAVAK